MYKPAVDADDLAGDVAGFAAGQETRPASATSSTVPSRPAGMSCRYSVRRSSGKSRGHLGLDQPGRDGVDGDLARRQLARHRLGEADDARLGGGVGRLPGVAHHADHRAHVDDASVVRRAACRAPPPGAVEGAAQVDGHHLRPTPPACRRSSRLSIVMPALLTRMCEAAGRLDDAGDRGRRWPSASATSNCTGSAAPPASRISRDGLLARPPRRARS